MTRPVLEGSPSDIFDGVLMMLGCADCDAVLSRNGLSPVISLGWSWDVTCLGTGSDHVIIWNVRISIRTISELIVRIAMAILIQKHSTLLINNLVFLNCLEEYYINKTGYWSKRSILLLKLFVEISENFQFLRC